MSPVAKTGYHVRVFVVKIYLEYKGIIMKNNCAHYLPNYFTGNPGSAIVPQDRSSKITVFVWGKNTILKFLGNTKYM